MKYLSAIILLFVCNISLGQYVLINPDGSQTRWYPPYRYDAAGRLITGADSSGFIPPVRPLQYVLFDAKGRPQYFNSYEEAIARKSADSLRSAAGVGSFGETATVLNGKADPSRAGVYKISNKEYLLIQGDGTVVVMRYKKKRWPFNR